MVSEYFIGLDIGTDSVGWAVTDTQYHIQKRKGKALWGVRLFPEAEKAEDRRKFRTSRRRLERRNQRLSWLREVFSEEIAKIDPAFFIRMDESKYLEEDKQILPNGKPLGRYTLFADKNYCDWDYHHEFPTIYHLRKALITEDREFDVRLIYLAVHHILKKRGHFLFGDMSLDEVRFEECWKDLCVLLQDEINCTFEISDIEKFKSILTDRTLNITRKKAALKKCANVSKTDKQLLAILDLLAGAAVKVSLVCDVKLSKDEDASFSFKGDFEDTEAKLNDLVGDYMPLIGMIKRVYDWSLLEELRGGEKYISFARVKVYEQHKTDLDNLKSLLRIDPKIFREMFRTSKKDLDNYTAYSGYRAENYRCDYEKFSTYVKRQLKAIMPKLDDAGKLLAEEILSRLETGIFLPKQTSRDNGVIPHQLHEQELKIILDRASEYLLFLNEKDGSGLTRKEQILAMFRFRIPYYIGPLNTASEKSWVVRTDEKIMPWNFDQVIDQFTSAENFIRRMTATCSYIGEAVLPKDSLLYSRFAALNMINKLKINDYPISVELKQRIFNQHLLANSRSNLNLLKGFLLSNGLIQEKDVLSGLDEGFKITLTGYSVFNRILSEGNREPMVEDIIKHIVLYGEDRKLLEGWLTHTYGKELSASDISYILSNRSRFKGWGNLSEQFLTQIKHTDPQTGEVWSIMDAMWNTNHNLMELLSGKFSFAQSIDLYRAEKYNGQQYTLDEILDDSYASPGIRRAIHQTMELISEIEKLMGGKPKRVFVEVTRSEGVKERTVSRKAQLESLYASCKKDADELYKQLQNFDDAALRSAKLYLYFTQMGRCMYSGEPIDLSRIATDYDIDHIYPQSLVKDDSFNNRVLVKKQLNAEKSATYPLSQSIRERMKAHWTMLKNKGLGFISAEKFHRLTRNTTFEESELSGFIARQLVETSQACKIVAELLKNRYDGSDRVVYVKAGNVSSFRQDQRILPDGTQKQASACRNIITKQDPVFVKCREVNDFHHAKDAYLNIVVGNVYHMKFTRDPRNFIRSGKTYSLNRMFDYDVIRDGECAWRSGDDGSIAVVRSTMRKNNILFTRYSREVTGGLFDQLIVPAGSGQTMIKSSDPRMTTQKYGGYNKLTGAYFALIEHTEKKKRVRSIETVLLMHKALYERDPKAYCETILALKEPKVLIPRIKIDSLVSYDGFRMHISGRTGSQIIYKNANPLVVSPEQSAYIKQIAKYLERCAKARDELKISLFDGITAELNIETYRLLLDKLNTLRYSVKYATAANTVAANFDKFKKLTLSEQCKVLIQILNLFSSNAASADLKLLCGKAGIGILLTSKNLRNAEGHRFVLINQSVTGVYEQEIDLLGDKF